MTIIRYCLCGASMHASSGSTAMVEDIEAMFLQAHTGEGHGDATQAQASRARRREERQLLAEEASR